MKQNGSPTVIRLRTGEIYQADEDIIVVGGQTREGFVMRAPGSNLSDHPALRDMRVDTNFIIGMDSVDETGTPRRTEVELIR